MASISGFVWEDANASRGFEAAIERRLGGWQVFIDANQNRAFDRGERTAITDSRGNYSFSNLPAGEFYVGQVLQPAFGQTFPGRQGSRGSNFDIEVIFPDDSLTSTQQAVFQEAAERWAQVIIGDLPDFNSIAAGRVVDDLAIEARLLNIDGPGGTLGQATFTERRPDSQGGLPTFGFMEFDLADFSPASANSEDFRSTVLHEMGHVLGFGTLWDNRDDLVAGENTSTPTYIGANALREYNRIFGGNETGVPLESGGGPGTRGSHWSEEVFDTELMTGFGSNGFSPLSTITVGQFADLGYTVNFSLADPYSPPLSGAAINNTRGTTPPPPTTPGNPRGEFNNSPRTPLRVLPASALAVAGGLSNAAPNNESTGLLPFTQVITVTADEARVDVNFGVIRNANPTIANVALSPTFQAIGSGIRVRANDIRTFTAPGNQGTNPVAEVRFFRESNGISGLQVAGDRNNQGVLLTSFDTAIGIDTDGDSGGWAVVARTSALSPGNVTFYALAFDQYDFTARSGRTGRLVLGPQSIPAAASSITSLGRSGSEIAVTFRDNSTDEIGYRIQASTDRTFRRGVITNEIFATNSQITGRGTRSVTIPGLAAGTEYFVRVSAFNTAGTSPAASSTAVTLSRGEVVVDNTDPAARRVGTWTVETVGTGFLGANYLFSDPSPTPSDNNVNPPITSIRYQPSLANRTNYFVFARRLPAIDTGDVDLNELINTPVPYQVRQGDRLVRSSTITRNSPILPGGWVLLGRFENRSDRPLTVRVVGENPFVVADAVRFLPSGVFTASSVATPASFNATSINATSINATLVNASLFSTSPIFVGPQRQTSDTDESVLV